MVQFHGVDDGTRVREDNWRMLRYVSAALMKEPPHGVMVQLERTEKPLPPETESVKINYLYQGQGSLVVTFIMFVFHAKYLVSQGIQWWN